jgi:hypothetical protein
MTHLLKAGLALAAACAALAAPGAAQRSVSRDTQPYFLGGYDPRACRFPPDARAAGLSGCCNMDLEINASGRVTKADGVCSDPVFLEPTRRCLSVQAFMPATRNGQAVAVTHHLEYEWRANAPSDGSLCRRLTS